ncbi:hypothetical protein D9619_004984 [Psilocybe cf. subviscida]|uniref:DUF6533 domain-containing protein n=1 Tax=Psilocybe cf. subviscida TaxID=2480587 RepID=A0A8H5F8W3_9AGAR|nr:hypothetical protein D9619_004984 [Psilocybe cf. subviscida]
MPVYDTLLTLDQEIQAIWQSKWNYARALYVLTRYSSFVEAGLLIALIMTIRTWAVWEKKRTTKYILVLTYIALILSGVAVSGKFVRKLEFYCLD